MKRLLLFAAIVVLVSATTASAALSPAEYRRQGNARCVVGDHAIARLAQPTTKAQYTGYLRALVKIQHATLADLAELPPPASLAVRHRRMVAAGQALLALYDLVLRRVAGGGDVQKVLAETEARVAKADKVAKAAFLALGLVRCAD